TDYIKKSAWLWRQMLVHLSAGPTLSRLNSDLLAAVRDLRFDYVLIDKGLWVRADTVQALKKTSGPTIVNYTPDPQVSRHPDNCPHFVRAIPEYDVLFTSKPFEIAEYRRLRARAVHLVHQSYDDTYLRPQSADRLDDRFASDVCFVGRYEPTRIPVLKAVA